MTYPSRDDYKYHSRFISLVHEIDDRVVRELRLTEATLVTWDLVVSACRLVTDQTNTRSWSDKFEEWGEQKLVNVNPETLIEGLTDLANSDPHPLIVGWVRGTRDRKATRALREAAGPAIYNRLRRSFQDDLNYVLLAVRQGVRVAMPWGVAWQDAMAVLSPAQLRDIFRNDTISISVIKLLIDLDRAVGERVLSRVPIEIANTHTVDLEDLDSTDIIRIVERFRPLVSEDTVAQIEKTNASLTRKIQGAKDALEHSADGVSQAANSLIELIDRLFRDSFSKENVLIWVERNLPDEAGLTYIRDDGARLPTKKAEALCFVYAGGSTQRQPTHGDNGLGPSFVHDALALALISVRNDLQGLKHADADDKRCKDRLLVALSAVEGALMLAIRVGWASASTTKLQNLNRVAESANA